MGDSPASYRSRKAHDTAGVRFALVTGHPITIGVDTASTLDKETIRFYIPVDAWNAYILQTSYN